MVILKVIIVIVLSIGLAIVSFLAGLASSINDPWIESFYSAGGGNILSPLAVFFSATIASVAAFFGLLINGRRERKKWTLDHLGYKRFSWIGIRAVKPCLDEINKKKSDLSSDDFDNYMKKNREENENFAKVISFLDSYQQLAFGIRHSLYHEKTARLVCSDKAIFLFDNALEYITWRRKTNISGIANESSVYHDFTELVLEWKIAAKKKFDKQKKKENIAQS